MIRAGILCVPMMDDEAVQAVVQLLQRTIPELLVLFEQSAASQRNWIEMCLVRWCDEDELDLIVTLGGTMPAPGPSQLEIVPEATIGVVERLLPGFSEAMRTNAARQTSLALLDRSVVGIRGRTLILNLPEGREPALLFLEAVIGLIEPTISHLQEDSRRVTLSNVLTPVDEQVEIDQHVDESHQMSENQFGLDADEFAAFLRDR
ncbi:MAG: hypothetical protein AAF639_23230 [Chloroflexota bacterium]